MSDSPTLEFLWENSIVGYAIVSKEGKFLKVNSALTDIVKYTKSELEEMTFQQITHPDDLSPDEEMVRLLTLGKIHNYSMVKRYITKLGTIVWVYLTVHRITDAQDILFLAQILKEKTIPSPSSSSTIPILTSNDKLKTFLIDNWYKIAIAIIAVISWISVMYHSWEVQNSKITLIEKQIQQLIDVNSNMDLNR